MACPGCALLCEATLQIIQAHGIASRCSKERKPLRQANAKGKGLVSEINSCAKQALRTHSGKINEVRKSLAGGKEGKGCRYDEDACEIVE